MTRDDGPMDREAVIELMAQTARDSYGGGVRWSEMEEDAKAGWRAEARVLLEALEAADLVRTERYAARPSRPKGEVRESPPYFAGRTAHDG